MILLAHHLEWPRKQEDFSLNTKQEACQTQVHSCHLHTTMRRPTLQSECCLSHSDCLRGGRIYIIHTGIHRNTLDFDVYACKNTIKFTGMLHNSPESTRKPKIFRYTVKGKLLNLQEYTGIPQILEVYVYRNTIKFTGMLYLVTGTL